MPNGLRTWFRCGAHPTANAVNEAFVYDGVYRIRHPYGRWIQVPPSPLTPHPIFMYATTTIRHVVRARKWHAPLHTLEGVGSKRNTIN